MRRRRVLRDICEIMEDSGYLCEPDDLPGSIARALDEAWRNGFSVGHDERDVVPDATEVRRLVSVADAQMNALAATLLTLGSVVLDHDMG